jgi:hypothetical protein
MTRIVQRTGELKKVMLASNLPNLHALHPMTHVLPQQKIVQGIGAQEVK